jgi:hypothetical protein
VQNTLMLANHAPTSQDRTPVLQDRKPVLQDRRPVLQDRKPVLQVHALNLRGATTRARMQGVRMLLSRNT